MLGSSSQPVEISVADLRTGMSPRIGVPDPNHARALAETFDSLPPILVHGETLTVLDGAVLFDGPEEQAYVEAVRSNTTHGRPLTVNEREHAAVRILHACSEWSDRRVGAVCGLSPQDRRPNPGAVN